MEAKALQRGLDILGLQFLFAPIHSLGAAVPKALPPTKREALKSLSVFLKQAMDGMELTIRRQQGDFESLASLAESVTAERAFFAIREALPGNTTEVRNQIQEINTICNELLSGKAPDPNTWGKLYFFTHQVLIHLARERFANLRDLQNVLP